MLDHLDDTRPFTPDHELRTTVRRAGNRRRRRARARSTALSITLVIALAGSALGVARWQASKVGRLDIASVPQRTPAGDIAVPELASFDKPITFLVVGSDRRPDDPTTRTDSMLLVRVDVAANRVRVLSLPRDLWVHVPDVAAGGEPGALPNQRTGRLNSVLEDGRATLLATVNAVTGVTVDHYVELDFGGFRALVDAVGGIPLQFPAAARDGHTGLSVEAGCHLLDGADALALSRSRHLETRRPDGRWVQDPTSDYGRMARQRIVAEAVVRRVTDRAGGVGGLTDLVRTVPEHAVLDDRLGLGDLVALARWSDGLSPEAVAMAMPDVRESNVGGAAVLELADGAGPRLRAFLDGNAPTPTASGEPIPTSPGSSPDGNSDRVPGAVSVPAPGTTCG